MNLFLELLQVALGTRDCLSRTPSDAEWNSLFNEIQRQAIVGVMLEGLERLPQEQLPSQQLLLQWIGVVNINEATYRLHCERAKELTRRFCQSGFHSCVLKGIGLAGLYPNPAHRQCGDIDLWVDRKHKDVLVYLRSEYSVENVFWHHAEARIFEDVSTEIHYRPCWMYNPFHNYKLQRWFDIRQREQMTLDEKLCFAYPKVQFNAVYSLAHFYHHLIEEGIGIRHVIDYYYILQALPANERGSVIEDLKRFGLLKLAKAVMWILKDVCGMSAEYLICEPNEKEGRFLFEEMMRGGNFGHYRNDNRKRNTVGRMFALLPHYPREVLWVVPWKLWHRIWMVFNQ